MASRTEHRFSGPQGILDSKGHSVPKAEGVKNKGVMRALRAEKRIEAETRNAAARRERRKTKPGEHYWERMEDQLGLQCSNEECEQVWLADRHRPRTQCPYIKSQTNQKATAGTTKQKAKVAT